MAAYAAVVSLLNTVDRILTDVFLSTTVDKKQTGSLYETVGFLEDFLSRYSHGGTQDALGLEKQIAYASYAAEDLLESHAANIIGVRFSFPFGLRVYSNTSFLDLQKVVEDFDSLKKRVLQIRDVRRLNGQPRLSEKTVVGSSTRASPAGKTFMVGFEEEQIQIMERLAGGESRRQIIPIVGMGSAGKTTLARSLYENPCIVEYFDIRIWITVSQDWVLRDLLLQIQICQTKQRNSKGLLSEDQLGEVLYKSLYGRRYLVVLDDIWSIDVWDRIKIFLPDNGN